MWLMYDWKKKCSDYIRIASTYATVTEKKMSSVEKIKNKNAGLFNRLNDRFSSIGFKIIMIT